jgi:cell shape-determining protein MreC
MQLLLIISLILIFAVLDAFIYSHLKTRTETALDRMDRDKKALQEQAAELEQQVQELKKTEQRLKQERLDLEKGQTENESEDLKTAQKPEELLLFDKIISPDQLARAKKYIQENASRLSILEALLLLNIIDAETASSVRSRIRAEREM